MQRETECPETRRSGHRSRRLMHGLLAMTVLVQPGCMCGCSTPAAARRADGQTLKLDPSPAQASARLEGECCAACSPAPPTPAPAVH